MDSNSDVVPNSSPDVISQVTALIEGQDEVQPAEGEGAADREDAQERDLRGEDGGDSADDVQQPDSDGGVPDAPEEGSQAADEGEGDPDNVTVADLAERLGVEASDVYELEVPIGDGVTATLSQLKDEFKQYGPVKEAEGKIKERESTFEKQVLATRAELNAIVAVIPPELRESVMRQAREHQSQWEQQQEAQVLEAIPDWQDADKRVTSRQQIVEDAAEFGFSESEVTYTQDARTLKWMHEFSKMKRELQEMRAATKAQPGSANRPGKARSTQSNKRRLAQAIRRAKADPTLQGKQAVVSQLIRNQ